MNREDIVERVKGGGPGMCGWPAGRFWLLGGSVAVLVLFVVLCGAGLVACDSAGKNDADGETTADVESGEVESGDIEAGVGEDAKVGKAIITVRALEVTFQPAMPEQRVSEQAPAAPSTGESFYQAYVTVQNTGVTPLRVDPEDFICAVGDTIVAIEPTRSGPLARSLLKSTSLDLLLTFEAPSGYEPVLIYRPDWYDGVLTVNPVSEGASTSST